MYQIPELTVGCREPLEPNLTIDQRSLSDRLLRGSVTMLGDSLT